MARRLERWLETLRADPADYTDDFVWDMSASGWPGQDEWRGPEGVDAFIEEWTSAWKDWSLEIIRIREGDPGRVAVESIQRGINKAAGVPVEMRFAQVWTIEADGRAAWMRMHLDVQAALAEAGVRAA